MTTNKSGKRTMQRVKRTRQRTKKGTRVKRTKMKRPRVKGPKVKRPRTKKRVHKRKSMKGGAWISSQEKKLARRQVEADLFASFQRPYLVKVLKGVTVRDQPDKTGTAEGRFNSGNKVIIDNYTKSSGVDQFVHTSEESKSGYRPKTRERLERLNMLNSTGGWIKVTSENGAPNLLIIGGEKGGIGYMAPPDDDLIDAGALKELRLARQSQDSRNEEARAAAEAKALSRLQSVNQAWGGMETDGRASGPGAAQRSLAFDDQVGLFAT
jgi:hypothetical protein